jgi:DNA sulfur modification protein DndC
MISAKQLGLFGGHRIQMNESIQLTIDSLNVYGPTHKHWAIAWSGGKDSTTLLTLVIYLIESGKVARPETLTVMYADTRMELLPLWLAALEIRDELAERNIETRVVMAPMDKRFLVYILGRGVPPPNNNTLRWCTRQIKIEPMADELRRLHGDRGEKILMLTGVRQGESAIRDGRIAMSCGKNGAECGQGWYQETLPGALCDTLAPLLHFPWFGGKSRAAPSSGPRSATCRTTSSPSPARSRCCSAARRRAAHRDGQRPRLLPRELLARGEARRSSSPSTPTGR